MKKISLFFSLLVFLNFTTLTSYSQELIQAPYSQEFNEYLYNPDSSNGHIPFPMKFFFDDDSRNIKKQMSLPAKFDLRLENRVTNPKNQKLNGDCWAFAAIGALESNLSTSAIYDFSENHLAYHHGFDWAKGDGGNNKMALAYMTRGQGPILEHEDPYDSEKKNYYIQPSKQLNSVYFIEQESIKEMLYKYGAVQTSIYDPDNNEKKLFFNELTHSQYYFGSKIANHDVIIVGWDDTYSKENFISPPPEDGAYIVENSWGEQWADGGYYYVSYYDSVIGKDNQVFTSADDFDPELTIYQYDELGQNSALGYDNTTTSWFANVFNLNTNKELLQKVSFYTTGSNTAYEVYLSDDFAKNRFSNLQSLDTGLLQYPGYHTIDLKNPVSLNNSTFAIVVKVAGNNPYPIPVEEKIPNYASAATASPGQSYTSANGNTWYDISKDGITNVTIKAFTSKETTSYVEPTYLKDAFSFGEKTTNDTSKVWTVNLNDNISSDSLNKILVLDAQTFEEVPTTNEISYDNKVLIRPVTPYISGKSYYIYIGDISSQKGTKLKTTIKFKFTIQ